nr:MlaA family lipoprotein [Azospirillaceae bacterium]
MKTAMRRRLAGVVVAAGLALAPGNAQALSDPLEPFNRAMFAFNRAVVDYLVNPVADTLGPALPQPVKTGLGNMYSNLTEVEFLLNGLLRADLPL